MARAGQRVLREDGRLEDRISVGVLARAFPRDAVEEVIEAAGAREQRNRMLPAWLTVYFVLALALFMDMGAGRVMRRLAGTLARAECGTRALAAAAIGGYATGEKTLARQLLGSLGPGMLVLADRNFAGYELWRDAGATGADLLWRIGASFTLPPGEVLADGTYLSGLKPPRELRKAGAPDITVRVIEYHLADEAGEVTETFTLITTLLDPDAAPARELADLYHARWEIETALGSFKSGMKGNGVVLRSKTPDGAEQEIWALLCAYHAIREMICAAAALARADPLRISFISALDTIRGPVGDPAAFPP